MKKYCFRAAEYNLVLRKPTSTVECCSNQQVGWHKLIDCNPKEKIENCISVMSIIKDDDVQETDVPQDVDI